MYFTCIKQARELAAKTQALADQEKQISQLANKSQAPNEPVGVLPTTSVPGPATKLAGASSTAGLGLLGEAPIQNFPPAPGPGGLLGFAPGTHAPPGMRSTPPLASQAPATSANLSNVSIIYSYYPELNIAKVIVQTRLPSIMRCFFLGDRVQLYFVLSASVIFSCLLI